MCDNGGFAVINRLQVGQGGAQFNNLWDTSLVVEPVPVDFAAHDRLHGLPGRARHTLAEFDTPFSQRARPTAPP